MTYLHHYGYLAMYGLLALGFVGIPVPDETLVVTFGGLTAEGHFVFWIALLMTFLGSMTGMMLSYTVGRVIGTPLLHKFGKWIFITPSRLEKTEKWFAKYGNWSVLFGYFVPGLRQVTSYLSGVYRLPLPVYLTYAGIGSAIWCTTFMCIGSLVGHNWRKIAIYLHHHVWRMSLLVLTILLIGLILYFFYKHLKSLRASKKENLK
nr:DedA family protein [Paenibacillus shirakamiensis]